MKHTNSTVWSLLTSQRMKTSPQGEENKSLIYDASARLTGTTQRAKQQCASRRTLPAVDALDGELEIQRVEGHLHAHLPGL